MCEPQISPRQRISQLSLGFANTAVLHALVKTGVIEQLREQPRSLSDLTEACNLNSDVLYRILRFATKLEVVTLFNEKYSLTETGYLLLKDVPDSMYPDLLLVGSESYQRAWHTLPQILNSGGNAFDPELGTDFFAFFDQHMQMLSDEEGTENVSGVLFEKHEHETVPNHTH